MAILCKYPASDTLNPSLNTKQLRKSISLHANLSCRKHSSRPRYKVLRGATGISVYFGNSTATVNQILARIRLKVSKVTPQIRCNNG